MFIQGRIYFAKPPYMHITKAQAAQYISTFGSSLKKQPVYLLCETEISVQQHSGSSGHNGCSATTVIYWYNFL